MYGRETHNHQYCIATVYLHQNVHANFIIKIPHNCISDCITTNILQYDTRNGADVVHITKLSTNINSLSEYHSKQIDIELHTRYEYLDAI